MSTLAPLTDPQVADADRPLAHRFFKEALENNHLAHAYVLKGRAYGDMYKLALSIAQVVNCKTPAAKGLACGQCTDCKWIMANSHPAVLTISRMTYLTNDPPPGHLPEFLGQDELEKLAKAGKWSAKIKTDAVARLIYELNIRSDHNRVVIFTDCEELPASIPSNAPAPYQWRGLENNEDKSLHIRPLNRGVFNDASVNRFLKTLEEPLPGTMFFFITENEDDLLPTVVSRCQVIPYSTNAPIPVNPLAEICRPVFDGVANAYRNGQPDAYLIVDQLGEFIAENGLSWPQLLDLFQLYLRERLLSNGADPVFFARYRAVQQPEENAIRQINAHTTASQVLVQLFLNLRIPLQGM